MPVVSPAPPRGFVGQWRSALRQRGFRWRFGWTVPALVAALFGFSRFVQHVERRSGVVLADPLLAWLPAHELSLPTFALIYGSLLVALVDLARRPLFLLRALMAYVFLVVARTAMMWVTPLDPPPGMVPLHDPLLQTLGPGELLTRDLFFSGHTSLLFLLTLSVPSRWLKAPMLVATIAVAGLVLVQHAHYTVDVLVAPCVAFCCVRLAALACERVSG